MAITKLKHHDRCDVQIVFGRSFHHHAHLECCDVNCKRKKKWIQWLGPDDTDQLRSMGIPVVTNRQHHTNNKKMMTWKDLGL